MRNGRRVGLIGLVALACAASAQEAPSAATLDLNAVVRRDWAKDALWDDGQAEVATYRGERVIFGETRHHTARLITVLEDFTKEYYVKADWPHGQKPILPVIKQIYTATIPTPNYDFQFMTSTFVDREDFGRLVKMSAVGHDWTGLTHKEFQMWGDKPRMIYNSYWDGEGSGRRDLGTDINDYFEEELPLVLRALPFEEGLAASLWLYPNQTTTRAPEPRPVAATIRVSAGNKSWIVDVEARDDRSLRYEFAAEEPHVMLRVRHSDGRSLELASVRREAYWILAE